MWVIHRDEGTLDDGQSMVLWSYQRHVAGRYADAKIELPPFVERLDCAARPPRAVSDPNIEREPVGCVDEVLFFNTPLVDVADQAVVHPCQVGTRVVRSVIRVLRSGTASDHVSVAQCGQGLPVSLVGRIESVIDEHPRVGGRAAEVQFAGIVEYDIRTRGLKLVAVALTVDSHDEPKSTAMSGLDPGNRVFDHSGMCGPHAQPSGRLEEHGRIGLTGQSELHRDLTVHDGVEHFRQLGGCEHLAGIATGGDEGDGNTGIAQTAQQRCRPRVGAQSLLLQFGQKQVILTGCQPGDSPRLGGIFEVAGIKVHPAGA